MKMDNIGDWYVQKIGPRANKVPISKLAKDP